MKVSCDRCKSESWEFFSVEADCGDTVATFEEEGTTEVCHVDRLPPAAYLLIHLPTLADSDGFSGSDYFYLCPFCVKELTEWLTETEIKRFKTTEPV
jgi:hypothetical protein